MPKFCTHCGQQIPEGARFCTKCGHEVSPVNADQDNNITSKVERTGRNKGTSFKFSTVIILLLLVIWGIRYFGPKIDTSWAVDAACAKVKSEVYSDYGDIPRVSGELIYIKWSKLYCFCEIRDTKWVESKLRLPGIWF